MNDNKSKQTKGDTNFGDNQNTTQTSSNGTNHDIIKLQNDLEQNQAKLQEMTNIAKQALADLQNFRRRAEEEKAAFVSFANAQLVTALLPILNSINLALKHEPKDPDWAKGAEQIFRQLLETLTKEGLQEIPTTNQPFNPRLHEALLVAPGEKDLVLEELEKGYMLGERVLKQARVKVGNGEIQK